MEEEAVVNMFEFTVFMANGASAVLVAPSIEVAAAVVTKDESEVVKIIKSKEVTVYVNQSMFEPQAK